MAYSISINRWQGEQRLQLELKAIRAHTELVLIDRGTRQYTAQLDGNLRAEAHQWRG